MRILYLYFANKKKRNSDESVYIKYMYYLNTAGNRHKQNNWFCKEIREDNFRFWWRRVHVDAS
jgi:hypothetical protein